MVKKKRQFGILIIIYYTDVLKINNGFSYNLTAFDTL